MGTDGARTTVGTSCYRTPRAAATGEAGGSRWHRDYDDLGNAIDLAPDGARIHAAIEQAGSLARLTVYDTAGAHGASFFVTLPVTAPKRWRRAG